MCRSSGPVSLYLPLQVWWLAPPTSGACPTGEPAIPTTGHSSLSMALADYPPVSGAPVVWGCLPRPWVSHGGLPSCLVFLHCFWVQLGDSLRWTRQAMCGGGLSCSGEALQHLRLCPLDFLLGWSWLWEWKWTSGLILVVDLPSLSIHSSNVAAAARAHQWASLVSASSCLPEVSCLSCWEALSQWQDGWVLVGSGSLLPPGCSPLLHLRQSFKEAKMSLVTFHAHLGPHGGGLGNLLSEYTWWKRSSISSWVVQYPTSWTADASASGSTLGRSCLQLPQTILSASFYPDSAACMNILWRMNGQCGPLLSQWGYSLRNNSTSRWHSALWTDIPPSFACSLVPSDLCNLSLYLNSSRAQ